MARDYVMKLVITAILLELCMSAEEGRKEQSAKPLSGYSVLMVEKFRVDSGAVKAGFLEAQTPVMRQKSFCNW